MSAFGNPLATWNTQEWLERGFFDWDILELNAYDAVIQEGRGNSGMSALIDRVAINPSAAAGSRRR